MSEDQPSLHIDTDWKKQAQEEKRRLAEQQEQQRSAARVPTAAPMPAPAGARGAPGAGGRAGRREAPTASFQSLVQSLMTQALLYLGEITARGIEPMLDLDRAKYQIDLLGVLDDKTRNNLTPDEQHLLDATLYELRTRFIHAASEFL